MIDLHMHTVYSDGTDTVKEILENAQKIGLEIISITDHQSVEAYKEIEQNLELRNIFKGQIITGCELKTTFNKVNIEVLAYGVDYKKIKIEKEDQAKVQTEILEYFKNVGKKLGLQFNDNMLFTEKNPFASNVFAEEILKYSDNFDILDEIGEKFDRVTFYRKHESNLSSPFYVDTSHYYIAIDELIKQIHEVGGLAFLAHGYEYPFLEKDEAIEEILKTTEIDGAECEYPTFLAEQRYNIKKMCEKYHKFMSGGTDYHALNKPKIKLGTGINENIKIDKKLIKDWINLVPKLEI